MGYEDNDGDLFEIDALTRKVGPSHQDHAWYHMTVLGLVLSYHWWIFLLCVFRFAFTTSDESIVRYEVRDHFLLQNVSIEDELMNPKSQRRNPLTFHP